jgi:A/G-specific adenine glycosylase
MPPVKRNNLKQTFSMPVIPDDQVRAFRRKVLDYYRRHGRSLPWRKTTDPYRITVSEIMLQQTQEERVIPKYGAWIQHWPDWRSLAEGSPRELLTAWSGLGYNRRALFLGKLARAVVEKHDGVLPDQPEQLRALPGIGPYTARAILIFAFNRPLVTIDTNIRKVLLHEFRLRGSIPADQLEQLAWQLLPKRKARDWHNALMDYGSVLLPKRIAGISPLSRQSRFEGSLRQIRGEIVRQLTVWPSVSLVQIARVLDRTMKDVRLAAAALQKDGVVNLSGNSVRLK